MEKKTIFTIFIPMTLILMLFLAGCESVGKATELTEDFGDEALPMAALAQEEPEAAMAAAPATYKVQCVFTGNTKNTESCYIKGKATEKFCVAKYNPNTDKTSCNFEINYQQGQAFKVKSSSTKQTFTFTFDKKKKVYRANIAHDTTIKHLTETDDGKDYETKGQIKKVNNVLAEDRCINDAVLTEYFLDQFKHVVRSENVTTQDGYNCLNGSIVIKQVDMCDDYIIDKDNDEECAEGKPLNTNPNKVTICHATSSATNPFVVITVNKHAVDGEGKNDHSAHEDDIIPFTDLNGDGFISRSECRYIICGNNITEFPDEQCDDGNIINGDGCSNFCRIEPPTNICGNNQTEVGEECDDGNTNDGDGCSATCQIEPPQPELCDDITMQVNIIRAAHRLNGYLEPVLVVGRPAVTYQSNEVIPLVVGGVAQIDTNFVEDSVGISVQRGNNSIRFLLYGSRAVDDREMIDMVVTLNNAVIKGFRNDMSYATTSPNKRNPIERPFDGNYTLGNPGQDELVVNMGSNTAHWYSTVNAANDGFYLDYECVN